MEIKIMSNVKSTIQNCLAKVTPVFYDFLPHQMRSHASIEFGRFIDNFIVSFSLYNPERAGKRVQRLYRNVEKAIRDHELWADQDIDAYMEDLEAYVMTQLFTLTFSSSPQDVNMDLEISKKISLLQTFVNPEHLDIPSYLWNEASLSLAAEELRKINNFTTPSLKLLCIMKCCKIVTKYLLHTASVIGNSAAVGADDFLPVLIYVVIKANPIELHSNLKYIELYRRQTKLVSEEANCLAHLHSAKVFISELNAKSLSIDEVKFEENLQAARSIEVEGLYASTINHNPVA